ncbi:hypothetical protein [Streptomyces griseosporeus]|uniref:hypothetical protein n=1 Tax=Streptomyces griseosporeus TaxID=1910 RepID=UPI00167DD852|nr:hypothetical protein [Streptomyces griseosporeus]GHF36613.1 hypothetical protein GCM10018783_01160 [Streptomyces griseosporeus]
MAAVVFVHGTGVRADAYESTWGLLRKGLDRIDPGIALHSCYWGGAHGVRPGMSSRTVPGYRGKEDLLPEDEKIVRWNLLYADPLYELRELGAAGGDRAGRRVLGDRSGPELERRATVLSVELPEELAELAGSAGADRLRLAVSSVLDGIRGSADCRRAIARASSDGTCASMLAAAVVAEFLAEYQLAGEPLPWTVEERDRAVLLISQALGADVRGVMGKLAVTPAMYVFNRVMNGRRDWVTDGSAFQVGDILHYAVRGEGLRQFIAERVSEVARSEGPVVLFAHSLGGIAAVDLLVDRALAEVSHLITAGSQTGQLYGMNALPSLEFGQPLPPHFPRWTNLYDRHDPLGFLAGQLFPGRVSDVDVTSGQPFLAAHSAYFTNPAVHRILADAIGECA